MRRITSTVHNNSILLRGEPGIGKTAVLHRLARRLAALDEPGFEFHPVYVDLEGVPERRFFATLADAILSELRPGFLGKEGGRRSPAADYGHRDLANDLRQVMSSLDRHSGTRVRIVLLIDGIDALERFHPRTAQRLRGLFMTNLSDSLVMVASAVAISKRWEREGSPWYNFFEEVEIGALTVEDARGMVEVCLRGLVDIDVDAVERILKLTECRPFQIRILCDRLIERFGGPDHRTISTAEVELAGSHEAR